MIIDKHPWCSELRRGTAGAVVGVGAAQLLRHGVQHPQVVHLPGPYQLVSRAHGNGVEKYCG